MIIDQLSIVRCCQARSREYITLNLNHHVNDDCSKCLQDQITTECNRNVVWLMCDDTQLALPSFLFVPINQRHQ